MCGIYFQNLCTFKEILSKYSNSSTGSKILESADDSKKKLGKAKAAQPQEIVPKKNVSKLKPTKELLDEFIGPRGPDYQTMICNNMKYIQLEDGEEQIDDGFEDNECICCYSSVLHLRGENITKQPFISSSELTEGNMLLYNGEIFKLQIQLSEKLKMVFEEDFGKNGLSQPENMFEMEEMEEIKNQSNDIEVPHLSKLLMNMDLEKGNDGKQLFEIFNCISLLLNLNRITLNQYKELFEGIIYEAMEGDFAICFYDNINQILVLSRDMFGKRSLLVQFDDNNSIAVMSTSILDQSYEIYEVPANAMIFLATSDTTCALSGGVDVNDVFSFTINSNENKLTSSSVNSINFMYCPSSIRWELEAFKSIDDTSKITFGEALNKVKDSLIKSVKIRIETIPEIMFHHDCHYESEMLQNFSLIPTKSDVAVLFSGGIDSTLLAAMIAEFNLCSIDLLHVNFSRTSSDFFTALISYHQLISKYPGVKINLIVIEKTIDDIKAEEDKIIHLLHPKSSHMDFNIACALHFASQGRGKVLDPLKFFDEGFCSCLSEITDACSEKEELKIEGDKKSYDDNMITKFIESKINLDSLDQCWAEGEYISSSKVLMSGLGADEVFGGYARYATASRRSLKDLQDEISLDLDRLWERNFGRDDRAISSNGKECRYPFLDKEVIRTASSIPIDFICDFEMHRGMGEKRILRQISKEMGLELVMHFEKRAIQFGTKIAKISNLSKFGSNRKANGVAQYT